MQDHAFALNHAGRSFGSALQLSGGVISSLSLGDSKPSSILARHFRGGQPTELPSLLQSITDKLEDYDEGLRRYPAVQADAPAPAGGGGADHSVGAGGADDSLGADAGLAGFRELQHAARSSAGIDRAIDGSDPALYRQYLEWLPFAYRNDVVLGRIADALGYERDQTASPPPTNTRPRHHG